MAETWRYRGQEIGGQQIAFLKEFIRTHLDISRWKLSRQICEALGWKQANGALRDVVCRGLLLMLERAGVIELPPVRRHIRGQSRTGRPRPETVLIDTTPLAMPLKQLGAIELQQVRRTADEPLFNSLMESHHYLKYEQPVGEHLKYLVWAQGRPVACLAWSSAPRHLGSRDRFIGWNGEARRRNIRFIGRVCTSTPSISWRPLWTRNGFGARATVRRTGWCWGGPQAGAKTITPTARTVRSKKYWATRSPRGFASYYKEEPNEISPARRGSTLGDLDRGTGGIGGAGTAGTL